jgi:hypothetical protein
VTERSVLELVSGARVTVYGSVVSVTADLRLAAQRADRYSIFLGKDGDVAICVPHVVMVSPAAPVAPPAARARPQPPAAAGRAHLTVVE